jgi:N-acyl-D-aspartate/D-glutamate deacylase
VKVLADFASSDAGKAYARIEQHWGRDPAAFLEDDVLAHNLRAALLVTLAEVTAGPEEDPVEHTRHAGDQIRKAMNG